MSARYPDFDGTQRCAEVGPEAFFSDSGNETEENQKAARLCEGCDFITECLEYALHWNVVGVWGGTGPKQRKKIRAKRGIVPEQLVKFDRALLRARVRQMTAQGLHTDVIAERLRISTRAVERNRSAGAA